MEIVRKAEQIIAKNRLNCIMALIDFNGYPTGSTITVSKNKKLEWLTFCTGLNSNKTKRIKQCKKAGICFSSIEPLYNITLIGDIDIITDNQTKNEMWYDGLKNHFTGPNDPNYCVLKFTTKRYKLMINGEETSIEENL